MTIDEAIEIKEAQFNDPWLAPKGKLAKADRLGIEALKRIQGYRKYKYIAHTAALKGETKD